MMNCPAGGNINRLKDKRVTLRGHSLFAFVSVTSAHRFRWRIVTGNDDTCLRYELKISNLSHIENEILLLYTIYGL